MSISENLRNNPDLSIDEILKQHNTNLKQVMNAPIKGSSLEPGAHASEISLNDKYTLERGRAFMTGTQALIRLPMLQRERDLKDKLPGFKVSTVEVSRKNAPHQRTLSVHFDDGSVLRIMLDPGVDYWEMTRGLQIAPTKRNVLNRERQIVIARLEPATIQEPA